MNKLKFFSLTMAFIVSMVMIICIIFSKLVPSILIRGFQIFIILTIVLSIATQSEFIEMSKKESVFLLLKVALPSLIGILIIYIFSKLHYIK